MQRFLGRLRPPLFSGVLPLRLNEVPGDIVAGFTLAALAIPEVMGYTRIAGTPVITGLYTLLIPALLFVIFGSSRHLVVGADSATAAILASGLVGIAAVGSGEYLALASLLALMVGVLMVLASVIGLGFMADFLSRTVLTGFLTGVGVQVAGGALLQLAGLTVQSHGTVAALWTDAKLSFDPNAAALVMAAAVLVVIGAGKLATRAFKRRVPGAMIAVIGAILASWAYDLGALMPVVGAVPSGLPELGLPDVALSPGLIWELLPIAFAMAVVVLAQSTATARAYAIKHEDRFSERQDLVGLGLANLGAGLSGTFMVNGSPTKTAMVDSAGGRSQLSLLVATLVVLLTLLFLTAPLAYLPDAVLLAVVFLIGLELVDLRGLAKVFRERRWEFWVALSTALVVVAFGVEEGIVFAILLSLMVHTRHGYMPKNFVMVPEPSGRWRAKTLQSRAEAVPGLLIYRFNHSMYYANAERMRTEIIGLSKRAGPPLRWFCLDVTAVDDIDFTAIEALAEIRATLGDRGTELVFAQNIDARAESREEIEARFADARFFESLEDVLHHYGERD